MDTTIKYAETPLTDNPELHHFEMMVEGHTAYIKYKKTDNYLFLIHAEVPAELKGKGAGSSMVEKAFQYADRHNLKVVPICSFVQKFLSLHKEWARLVAADAGRFM